MFLRSLMTATIFFTLSAMAKDKVEHGDLKAVGEDTGSPKLKPCGNTGSVEERIKDCTKLPNAEVITKVGKKWNLVARSADGKEVWRDATTKLVWGDTLDEKMSSFDAHKSCSDKKYENSRAGIESVEWSLPTSGDVERAQKNGLTEVIPNMEKRTFWSSTTTRVPGTKPDPWLTYSQGHMNGWADDSGSNKAYARCVGQ
jgi:hypothetical protein